MNTELFNQAQKDIDSYFSYLTEEEKLPLLLSTYFINLDRSTQSLCYIGPWIIFSEEMFYIENSKATHLYAYFNKDQKFQFNNKSYYIGDDGEAKVCDLILDKF
jgi:hypothetical protein